MLTTGSFKRHHSLYATIIGASCALCLPTQAAQLEEVVVTAQKRVESLQDVPISVHVTSGEKLNEFSIKGLSELSASIPNVHIGENATQDSVTIRAIGSGANHGFEQSVGTFIDGVYFGRGRSSRSPFLDAERVEVLKGPQGVLFGKNTIAGALNITTRKPGDEFEGSVEAEYFDGDDSYGFTGVVSGPISDTVGARLVARVADRNGYVQNLATGKDDPREEEWLVRAIVTFQPADQWDITLKAEISSFDQDGRAFQLASGGVVSGLMSAFDPNFEDNLNYKRSINSAVWGDDFDYTDSQNITATVRYDFDTVSVVSTTALVGYEYENLIGGHFIANIDLGAKMYDEEHKQFSQEIRFESNLDGDFQYLAGVFYQTETIDHFQAFGFNTVATWTALGGQFPFADGSRIWDLEQDTDSVAAFAQGTWTINNRLRASLGLRYTKDEKDFTFSRFLVGQPFPFPDGPSYDAKEDRDDSDVTPSANIQWDATDEIMIYASYSEGFKSGGFDFESAIEFEEETVDAWEIGIKSVLADGSVELNAALFRSEFTGLQTAAWIIDHFETGNAGVAVTEGLEVDFRWQINDKLMLSGAVAWLSAEYDEFEDGNCSYFGGANGLCTPGLPFDQTGDSLSFAPDYSGSVSLEYVDDISDSLELTLNVGIDFSDAYFTAVDLDPATEQDSFAKLNARVQLASIDHWSVALVGKNLTEEKTTTWVNDHPVFNNHGAYFAQIDPPRSIGLQVKYQF